MLCLGEFKYLEWTVCGALSATFARGSLESFLAARPNVAENDSMCKPSIGKSGEQGVVLKATDECTKAEWIFLLESLRNR